MKTTQEINQSKSPDKTGIKAGRNEKGQFVKGVSGNPKGYPKGQKNFTTLMDDVIKKYAIANNKTDAEVWEVLIQKGFTEATGGNYMFFRDILDRYFGKAHDIFEGDPDKPLIIQIAEEVAKKNKLNE